MKVYNSTIKRILNLIPGKKRFGLYRFLPVFFCLGAALEYSMIKWTVGETNFCMTFFALKNLFFNWLKFQIGLLKNVRQKITLKKIYTIALLHKRLQFHNFKKITYYSIS